MKEGSMPIYDFECPKCVYYTEIKQGINDPSKYECPHCGEDTLIKVFINPPAVFVRGDAHTIGQLADRNTQKMGKYELADRNQQHGIKRNNEVEQKRETHKKINSMTPEQKLNWIHSGD